MHVLFVDLLPLLACCLAIFFVVWRWRTRAGAALLVFASSVVVACVYVAMHLEINGQSAAEMQRFFVVPFFAAFVVGLALAGKTKPGSMGAGLLAAAVGAPALFSAYWLLVAVPGELKNERLGATWNVDCRTRAGAHLGDPPTRKYVESTPEAYFRYAECRPVFSPGGTDHPWPTKIFPHWDSDEQLGALDPEPLGPGGAWTAVCLAHPAAAHDKVCRRLLETPTTCKADGEDFLDCALTPELRSSIAPELPKLPQPTFGRR